jgi:hypothetical protein
VANIRESISRPRELVLVAARAPPAADESNTPAMTTRRETAI